MYKGKFHYDYNGEGNGAETTDIAAPEPELLQLLPPTTRPNTVVLPRGNVIVCRGQPRQLSSQTDEPHLNNNGTNSNVETDNYEPAYLRTASSPKLTEEVILNLDEQKPNYSSFPPKKKFVIQAQADAEKVKLTGVDDKEDDDDKTDLLLEETGKPSKLFKCAECAREFKHKSYFDYHMRTHKGERPHKCHLCDKSFFERSKLNRHLSSCHKLKNTNYQSEEDDEASRTCPKCHKIFSRVSGLQAHLLTHDKVRPFTCSKCGQKFSGLTALKNHEKVKHNEEGVKTLMCDLCGKKFLLKKYLDLHLKTTHKQKERDHKCSKCRREFHSAKDLRRHELMHSKAKNFECHLCPASFKRKDNFNRHLKLIHLFVSGSGDEGNAGESSEIEIIHLPEVTPAIMPPNPVTVQPPPPPPPPPPRQVSVIRSTHEFMMSITRGEAQF